MDAARQQTLAASQCQWIQEQVQIVDQIVRKQRVHELTAAVRVRMLRPGCLQRPHGLDHIVADDGRIAPDWLVERP